MKKLLIAVGALVVLVLVGIVAAPFLIPVSVYKTQIEAQAKAATGRDLKIQGDMRLSVFPSIAIEAKDVRFANVPGAATPDMARLKSLLVSVKLQPLLSGVLEVESFVLDEPVISLEIDKQGRGNWVFDGGAAAPAPSATRSTPTSVQGELKLGEVRLKNGRLTYSDARTGTRHELSAVNATVNLPDLDRPMSFDGGATWQGKALSLKLGADKPRALMLGQPAAVTLELGGDPVKIGFKGQVATAGQPKVQGDVTLAIPSVKELGAWVGAPIDARPNTLGALAIAGKLDMQGPKLAFTGATVSLDQIKGSGDIAVDTSGAKPHLRAKLALEKLDVNPYLPPEAAAPAGGGQGAPASSAGGWSEAPIDLTGLRAANADLDLTVGGLVIRKIEIGKGAIKAQLRDGKLALDLTELALYGGSGQAKVQLDGAAAVPAVEAQIKLAGVQAEPLLKVAAEFDRLSGAFATDGQVSARGRSQKEMVSALTGKGQFAFTDGAIKGINLGAMVRNVSTAFTDPTARETQKTDFSELSGTYTIAAGIVTNTDLSLKSPLLRIEGKGSVNLPQRSLDYRVEPKVAMTTEGQGGQMQAAGVMVPVVVKGPWDNLTYQPDLAALLKVDPSKLGDALKGGIPALPGVALPGAATPQTPAAGAPTSGAPAAQPQNPLGGLRNLLNR